MRKILLFLFIGICQLAIGQKTWTGTSSNDWNVPTNWNPVGVPTSTDDITIGMEAEVYINNPQVVASIYLIGNAQLFINNDLSCNGEFEAANSTSISWMDGNLNLNGPTNIGGFFEIVGNETKIIHGNSTFDVYGSTHISTGIQLNFNNVYFGNSGDLQLVGNTTISGTNEFRNFSYGTITKTDAATTSISVNFNNEGIVNCNAGILEFNNYTVFNNCRVNIASGATAKINAPIDFFETATSSLDGTLELDTDDINFNSSIFNSNGSGQLLFTRGTTNGGWTFYGKMVIPQPDNIKFEYGVYHNYGSIHIMSGNQFRFEGEEFINHLNANFYIDGVIPSIYFSTNPENKNFVNYGTIHKNSTGNTNFRTEFYNSGTVNINAGNLQHQGYYNELNGGIYNVVANSSLLFAGRSQLQSTLSGNINGTLALGEEVLLDNSTRFEFTVGDNGVFSLSPYFIDGTGTLTNASKTTVVSSTPILVSNINFQNEGAFNLQNNTQITFDESVIGFNQIANATLSGNGTIDMLPLEKQNISGIIRPNGTLQINGGLKTQNTAEFQFNLRSASDYDKINTTANSEISGAILVTLNYAPTIGTVFNLINSTNIIQENINHEYNQAIFNGQTYNFQKTVTANNIRLEVINSMQEYPFFLDEDFDGFGSDLVVYVESSSPDEAPLGYSVNSSDCDDSNSDIWEMRSFYNDFDGDGYTFGEPIEMCVGNSIPSGYSETSLGEDCDDNNPFIHPNADEIPGNGKDDNCDGNIDENDVIPTTQITASQCGIELESLGTIIHADPVSAAIRYRFRIKNTVTNQITIFTSVAPEFNLMSLVQIGFGRTYEIAVQIETSSGWTGVYGPNCFVTTPLNGIGPNTINEDQCDVVIPRLTAMIYTKSLNAATGYRYRITNLTNPESPNAVQTIDRSVHYFSLVNLPSYTYGTTYSVEVATLVNGNYTNYGEACLIHTPDIPALVDCGKTISTKTQWIYTTSTTLVTQYKFLVTHLDSGNTYEIIRPTNYFNMSSLPEYDSSQEYSVQVALYTSNTWSDFGPICSINTSAIERIKEPILSETDFIPAPNPFKEAFNIKSIQASDETISVMIYDLSGRRLSQDVTNRYTIENQDFGKRLPQGIYTIEISQGNISKKVKMIKN